MPSCSTVCFLRFVNGWQRVCDHCLLLFPGCCKDVQEFNRVLCDNLEERMKKTVVEGAIAGVR